MKLLRSISGNHVDVVVQNTQKNSADNNNKRRRERRKKVEREMTSKTRFSRHSHKSAHHTYGQMNVYWATRRKEIILRRSRRNLIDVDVRSNVT